MKCDTLFEKPSLSDTLGTMGRAAASRSGSEFLARMGSDRARGQHRTRVIADALMQQFMQYVGSQGIRNITDAEVKKFIDAYYSDEAAEINIPGGSPPGQTGTQPPPGPSAPPPGPGQTPPGSTPGPTAGPSTSTNQAPSGPSAPGAGFANRTDRTEPRMTATPAPATATPAVSRTASVPGSGFANRTDRTEPRVTAPTTAPRGGGWANQTGRVEPRAIPPVPPGGSTASAGLPSDPPARPGAAVHSALAQIGTELRKPTPDPWWVMATLNNALQTTQRGTPQRQEVVAMLRALQRNPQVTAKIPQLNQIAAESRDRIFDMAVFLVENNIRTKPELLRTYRMFLEDYELKRSELDTVFIQLARVLVKKNSLGKLPGTQGPQNPRQNNRRASDKQHSPYIDEKKITPDIIQTMRTHYYTAYNNIDHGDRTQIEALVGQDGTTIKQIRASLHQLVVQQSFNQFLEIVKTMAQRREI